MLFYYKKNSGKDVKNMNVKEKVYKILKELSCAETVNDSDRLQEDLMLDSLLMVTLLINIEESLDIQLNESDMNPFDLVTTGDVIRLAERYGGGSHE